MLLFDLVLQRDRFPYHNGQLNQYYHVNALTKFLPICHDSGFHYRAPTTKASDW